MNQDEIVNTIKGKGYSLQEFANEVGLAPTTLSYILKGKHQAKTSTLRKIAHQLGWSPAKLGALLLERVFEKDQPT